VPSVTYASRANTSNSSGASSPKAASAATAAAAPSDRWLSQNMACLSSVLDIAAVVPVSAWSAPPVAIVAPVGSPRSGGTAFLPGHGPMTLGAVSAHAMHDVPQSYPADSYPALADAARVPDAAHRPQPLQRRRQGSSHNLSRASTSASRGTPDAVGDCSPAVGSPAQQGSSSLYVRMPTASSAATVGASAVGCTSNGPAPLSMRSKSVGTAGSSPASPIPLAARSRPHDGSPTPNDSLVHGCGPRQSPSMLAAAGKARGDLRQRSNAGDARQPRARSLPQLRTWRASVADRETEACLMRAVIASLKNVGISDERLEPQSGSPPQRVTSRGSAAAAGAAAAPSDVATSELSSAVDLSSSAGQAGVGGAGGPGRGKGGRGKGGQGGRGRGRNAGGIARDAQHASTMLRDGHGPPQRMQHLPPHYPHMAVGGNGVGPQGMLYRPPMGPMHGMPVVIYPSFPPHHSGGPRYASPARAGPPSDSQRQRGGGGPSFPSPRGLQAPPAFFKSPPPGNTPQGPPVRGAFNPSHGVNPQSAHQPPPFPHIGPQPGRAHPDSRNGHRAMPMVIVSNPYAAMHLAQPPERSGRGGRGSGDNRMMQSWRPPTSPDASFPHQMMQQQYSPAPHVVYVAIPTQHAPHGPPFGPQLPPSADGSPNGGHYLQQHDGSDGGVHPAHWGGGQVDGRHRGDGSREWNRSLRSGGRGRGAYHPHDKFTPNGPSVGVSPATSHNGTFHRHYPDYAVGAPGGFNSEQKGRRQQGGGGPGGWGQYSGASMREERGAAVGGGGSRGSGGRRSWVPGRGEGRECGRGAGRGDAVAADAEAPQRSSEGE
jgi:hypothetical protein